MAGFQKLPNELFSSIPFISSQKLRKSIRETKYINDKTSQPYIIEPICFKVGSISYNIDTIDLCLV